MKGDPFGNLRDWGGALDALQDLSENGNLPECQPGLIRILRYKGNWRLREEVLRCVGAVPSACQELIHQVIAIIDDDNIYYDARIMACDALIQLLRNTGDNGANGIHGRTRKVIEKLKQTPQPPFFERSIDRLSAEVPVMAPFN